MVKASIKKAIKTTLKLKTSVAHQAILDELTNIIHNAIMNTNISLNYASIAEKVVEDVENCDNLTEWLEPVERDFGQIYCTSLAYLLADFPCMFSLLYYEFFGQ